jgi:hypothetical protein
MIRKKLLPEKMALRIQHDVGYIRNGCCGWI